VIWQELCAESIPHIDYAIPIIGGFMEICYLDNGLAFFLVCFFCARQRISWQKLWI